MKNIMFTWLKQKQVKLNKPLFILSLLQLIMSLTAIFFAFFSRETIDTAIESTESSNFIIYAVILGSLLLIQLISSTITPYIKTSYQVKLENNLKSHMFQRLLISKLKETQNYHTGDLLNHLSSDIHIIAEGVMDLLPRLIFYVIRFLGAFVLLFFIDKFLSLVIIGFGIVLFFGSRLLAKPIKTRHKKLQEAESNVRSIVQESLSHIPVIKSFEAEEKMTKRLDAYNDTFYHAALKKQRLSMLSSFGMTGFLAVGYGLAIILGAMRLSNGALTVGGLTALVQLVGHLQSPFSGLSNLVPKYYQVIASIERMKILDSLENDSQSDEHITSFDEITASNLNFSYQDEQVIKDLSFTIKHKSVVQIIGESGKGKTTLIKLLLGLYEPTSGELSVTYHGKKQILNSATRSLFTYVPQGQMMMSGTIKENLELYQSSDDDKLRHALRTSCLDQDIQKLPDQLETMLGEKGSGLSEGQIQRLALARALLKDAPIIILDEITSALDQETESIVLKNIKVMTDKTIILISHRKLPEAYVSHSIHLS